jgi:hypothetical protein
MSTFDHKFVSDPNFLDPSPIYAFGDQEPFREKVPGLPKAFYYKKFLGVSGPFFKKGSATPTH